MQNYEHGGNLYAAMRDKKIHMAEFLDFSANINPLGMPDSLVKAVNRALPYIIHYPDTEARELKEAIRFRYGIPEGSITVGNGAVEVIYLLCHMLKPQKVLVAAPTFGEYERAARASGAEVAYYYLQPDSRFAIDLHEWIKCAAGVDMLFLGNPNNPTGNLLQYQDIQTILEALKGENTLVVVDESFLDFLDDDRSYSCRHLLPLYPNLIIIHSLTKFYAMPGLRLGFAAANDPITAMLHAGKDPWNVNSLAQSAGVAVLYDDDYRERSKCFVQKVKDELYTALSALSCIKPYPPSVNFILINIKLTGFSAQELRNKLEQYRILVRDCSNYPGLSNEYIRVAVKQPRQNERLLAALETVMSKR
ncbi:hypothetical protein P22_0081 [Propionispora sp. 2/2-37]|uniref:threonine-phosphate decarboxylase CobD n=1 Tax=Propionispora sp. 2/2-37 TaxID=1677858 RepID=UPI0006C27A67|nr:threonine-phosphate decarboxylase CobD [Propionispora sp. 2/2-37]CUH94019.1 hypothetical protein P22_0081 [Propionispora sp. 2/2-37]